MKKILVGAGVYGKEAMNMYGSKNCAYFVDNNPIKQGTQIDGVSVISMEELAKLYNPDFYEVVITCKGADFVKKQLEGLSIPFVLFRDKDRRFYSFSQLILNQYDNNETQNEQEWNKIQKNTPLKDMIRLKVDELKVNVPLFNHVEIETINRCNGVCSFCPVNAKNDSREKKVMSEELFYSVVDQLSRIEYSGRISLFSNNEPFLDNRIIEFNQYVREKLPKAHLYLFTNGTLLTIDKFIQIIKILDELIIDNYTQDLQLHDKSRAIKEYCELHPELKEKVTILLRKPNEILTSRGGDAPNRKEMISHKDATCILPFCQLIVRPDGKVSLCCNDPLGRNTLGDLSKDTILDIWYGEKYKIAREHIARGRGEWEHCVYCDTWQMLDF